MINKISRSLFALFLGLAAAVVIAKPASAQTTQPTTHPTIRLVEVSGYLDPILSDFIVNSVHQSEKAKDEILIIQFDMHGTFLKPSRFNQLTNTIKNSKVPVAVWVGGVGARATGGTFSVAQAADIVGAAPATAIEVNGESLTAAQALQRNLVQITVPVMQQFVFQLDGKIVKGQTLHTAATSSTDQKQRIITAEISFSKPSILARFLHAAASPSIAYLFLVAGLLLIVFEFFAVSIGISAACGVLLLVPAAYGLGVVPVHPISLAVIVFSILAASIDIQAGASRAWTAIGMTLFVVGSLTLYNGLSLPLLTFVPVFLLTLTFFLTGMPSTIRSRFSLPSVGREQMLGQMGTAKSAVNPEGIIDLRGGAWPARTNRSTPIAAGAAIRVVGIEGSVLEVEPEVGGAKDAHH